MRILLTVSSVVPRLVVRSFGLQHDRQVPDLDPTSHVHNTATHGCRSDAVYWHRCQAADIKLATWKHTAAVWNVLLPEAIHIPMQEYTCRTTKTNTMSNFGCAHNAFPTGHPTTTKWDPPPVCHHDGLPSQISLSCIAAVKSVHSIDAYPVITANGRACKRCMCTAITSCTLPITPQPGTHCRPLGGTQARPGVPHRGGTHSA